MKTPIAPQQPNHQPNQFSEHNHKRPMRIKQPNQQGYATVAYIINLVFGIIFALVALRFVFRLLGVAADSGFVNFVYQSSEPFVRPFYGLFGVSPSVATGHFDVAAVVALIVYGLIAAAVSSLGSYRSHRI